MTFNNRISFPTLANTASLMHFCVLMVLLLTCLQEAQVIAQPTGNAIIPTQKSTKNCNTTQYPPTTAVQYTIPGTKGVSGFSFHHLENARAL